MTKPENRKKGWGFGPAFFFIAAIMTTSSAASYELFGRTENQFLSEPEPIRASLNDWGSEFSRGERQWAISHFELGVRYQGIEVSVQQRGLVDLRMNAELAEYWGRIDAGLPLDEGAQIPAQLSVDGFSARALRLGYLFTWDRGALTVGAAVLDAKHLVAGDLAGDIQVTNSSDYVFSAQVDYSYYRDVLFNRPIANEPVGMGWAGDLRAHWQLDESWLFSLKVDDIFARIRWEDAPYTIARGDSDIKPGDGSSLGSGIEGYRDVSQRLDPRYQIATVLSEGPWSAHLQGQYQFGYGFVGFGAGYRYASGLALKGLYWPKYKTIGVEAEYKGWRAALAADQLEWRKVQSLSFSLSYGY